MNDKNLIKIGILIWSLVAIIGIGAFAFLASNGSFGLSHVFFNGFYNSKSYHNFEEVENKVITEDIQNIDIEWVSGKVYLLKSEDDKIKVIHQANAEELNQKKMMVNVQGNRLMISDKSSKVIKNPPETLLYLYLPEKEYNEIKADNISSDITTDFIKCNTLKLSTISGEMTPIGEFDKVELETVSGNIKTENISARTIDLETVSGFISITGKMNEVDINTVSGDVNVTSSTMLDSLESNAVSGTVTVNIPENDGFTVYMDKVFAKFTSDFPVTISDNKQIYKNGTSTFRVDLVSGHFKLGKIS